MSTRIEPFFAWALPEEHRKDTTYKWRLGNHSYEVAIIPLEGERAADYQQVLEHATLFRNRRMPGIVNTIAYQGSSLFNVFPRTLGM